MSIEVNNQVLETDDQGYLIDPTEWNFDVAETFARQADITLSEDHKKILTFIRDYFDEHQVAADARFVIKYIADDLGYGDKAREYLYELFPYGYMQQVCKIAGMKRPRAWSTG